jgi:hypothetical protein
LHITHEKTYTKEEILAAAKLEEVNMIDANHICSLLEEEKKKCSN